MKRDWSASPPRPMAAAAASTAAAEARRRSGGGSAGGGESVAGSAAHTPDSATAGDGGTLGGLVASASVAVAKKLRREPEAAASGNHVGSATDAGMDAVADVGEEPSNGDNDDNATPPLTPTMAAEGVGRAGDEGALTDGDPDGGLGGGRRGQYRPVDDAPSSHKTPRAVDVRLAGSAGGGSDGAWSPWTPHVRVSHPGVLALLVQFDELSKNGLQELTLQAILDRCSVSHLQFLATAIIPYLQRDFISKLPNEVAVKILGYLEPRSLVRAGAVSHAWRRLAHDELLWKRLCLRHGFFFDFAIAAPVAVRPYVRELGCARPTASPAYRGLMG